MIEPLLLACTQCIHTWLYIYWCVFCCLLLGKPKFERPMPFSTSIVKVIKRYVARAHGLAYNRLQNSCQAMGEWHEMHSRMPLSHGLTTTMCTCTIVIYLSKFGCQATEKGSWTACEGYVILYKGWMHVYICLRFPRQDNCFPESSSCQEYVLIDKLPCILTFGLCGGIV